MISLVVTIALTVALSWRFDPLPPLGTFLDPFHGFWQNAEGEPAFAETIELPGLHESVEVQYDSLLIPHIFAQNDADLYRTQGYVQAAMRLWQMEFVTHVAAGRVSEIVGSRALEYDRLQRRKGLSFAAERAWRLMEEDPKTKEIVTAYAEGINAYIENLDYEGLPIEYKLLDYRPEPWSPIKTALLLKYMADDLAGHDEDLENTNALALLGKERFDFLYPQYVADSDPIISSERSWDFEPVGLDTPQISFGAGALKTQPLPKPDPNNGSNNWAVSGSRTRSGNPLLANDPHLGLNLPNIWFALQLQTPEVNVFGATLPGAPGVIIGCNDSIAWGVTNAKRDVKDWYKITFNDNNRDEYLFDGRYLKTQKRVEEIEVRDGESFYDTVVYTHHGPVTYDAEFPADSVLNEERNYAMKWTAHEASAEIMTFYELNRAKSFKDYRKALRHYQAPAQNFVFASVQGSIAMTVQGKFPAKWVGQGQFLMDGSRPEHEWQSYIPFEHNAFEHNPERGFVSSANQVPVDSAYPYYFYDKGYEHFRNRRINHQLARMRRATPEDMMTLQEDNYNQRAADILPLMLDSLPTTSLNSDAKAVYEKLRQWNLQNDRSQSSPTVFYRWWQAYKRLLWDELADTKTAFVNPSDAATIHYTIRSPLDTMVDRVGTGARETIPDLLAESFSQTVATLNDWKKEHDEGEYQWQDYKATSVEHMLKIAPFGTFDVPIGGGRGIVNATSERHGPSWRMVVELSDPVQVWTVYPGGQSGNPGSVYYDNMIKDWAAGEHHSVQFIQSPDALDTHIMFSQAFEPADVD